MSKGEAWCLVGLTCQKQKAANVTRLAGFTGLKNPVHSVILLILQQTGTCHIQFSSCGSSGTLEALTLCRVAGKIL
jgi:hypothetical protein